MSAPQRVGHAAKTIRARWEQGVEESPQVDAARALEDAGQLLDPEVAVELATLRAEVPELRALVEAMCAAATGPAGPESQALTAERLAGIAARTEAATAGPWCADAWEIYQGSEYVPGVSLWIGETCRGTGSPEQDRADAAFVAHAREDVPALLARVAALESERHTTNEALAEQTEACRKAEARVAELEDVERRLLALLPTKPWGSWSGLPSELAAARGEYEAWQQVAEVLDVRLPYVRPVDEDPIAYALTDKADALCEGPQRHDYRLGRDLPETGGEPR